MVGRSDAPGRQELFAEIAFEEAYQAACEAETTICIVDPDGLWNSVDGLWNSVWAGPIEGRP